MLIIRFSSDLIILVVKLTAHLLYVTEESPKNLLLINLINNKLHMKSI